MLVVIGSQWPWDQLPVNTSISHFPLLAFIEFSIYGLSLLVDLRFLIVYRTTFAINMYIIINEPLFYDYVRLYLAFNTQNTHKAH